MVKELSSRTANNEQLTAQVNRLKTQIEHYEKQISDQLKRIADLEDQTQKNSIELTSYKERSGHLTALSSVKEQQLTEEVSKYKILYEQSVKKQEDAQKEIEALNKVTGQQNLSAQDYKHHVEHLMERIYQLEIQIEEKQAEKVIPL